MQAQRRLIRFGVMPISSPYRCGASLTVPRRRAAPRCSGLGWLATSPRMCGMLMAAMECSAAEGPSNVGFCSKS